MIVTTDKIEEIREWLNQTHRWDAQTALEAADKCIVLLRAYDESQARLREFEAKCQYLDRELTIARWKESPGQGG